MRKRTQVAGAVFVLLGCLLIVGVVKSGRLHLSQGEPSQHDGLQQTRTTATPASSSPLSTAGIAPTGGAPAPATGPGPGSISHSHPALTNDPTASMPVVASFEQPDSTHPGMIRRVRVVKAHFKYPLWRVEELIQPAAHGQPEAIRSRNIMIADHAMVRLADHAGSDELQNLAQSHGFTIRRMMKMPGCYLVSTSDQSTEALPRLLAALNASQEIVRYAEPDYIVRSQSTIPNDPLFSSLWGLSNTSRPGADISAPQVWDLTTGDTQVVVAVIDTGVDYNHPDLAGNLWTNTAESANGTDDDGNGYVDDVRGWNFCDDNNDPMDGHSHGTHVSGTIGAIGNNSNGVVGVNWHCTIMALKFLDNAGNGTDSDAADALHYVADLRRRGVNIRITNNSWGGGDYSTTLRDAIRENASLGILFIAAAGNSTVDNDATPFYPAAYGESNILAVAATDFNDGLAYFSNYGATTVHLGAPGMNILSTTPGGSYGTKSGTSMATPHVTGVATLLWNTWPTAHAEDIRDAILKGTDAIPALFGRTITGGRLNAGKALYSLFRISHTPMANTYNTGSDYSIDAEIGPSLLVDTNQLFLYWNLDGSTNYSQTALTSVSNSLYRAFVPAQPEGSTIRYWLTAATTNGLTALLPSNAPASFYAFQIRPPISLTVTGLPSSVSSVFPSYGSFTYASGTVFQAVAPASTIPTNGMRWTCMGWTGSGSVPATGTTSTVTFTLTNNSTLAWQWKLEYALAHNCAYVAALNRTTWWQGGSLATSLTAVASVVPGSVVYRFIGWELDGARQPDLTQRAANPVAGILMNQSHRATALYLPETQDANTNNIGDWWEFYYVGTTNMDPNADTDGDGFSNLDEFKDRTDPTNPDSHPTLPTILHIPLASLQPHPAPFPIEATITDNYQVSSAVLFWNRNGGTTSSNTMSAGGSNLYTATIPAPGTNSDYFTYWIVASDNIGSITNGPHSFTTGYPIVSTAPARLEALLFPESTSNLNLSVTNNGGAPLLANLKLLWGGLSHDVEAGAEGWTHSGANDEWIISTNRSTSGTHAWYCGNPTTLSYASSMHAKLDSPLIFIAEGAQLSFDHWIQCELDTQFWRRGWNANDCWDGGIVEISTDYGATFQTITPVDGYPNLISGYAESPWPDATPCFAGTGLWSHATFDLSAFHGCTAIVRFHFGSDGNTEEEGWYLDNIVVSPVIAPQSWVFLVSSNLTTGPTAVTTPEVITLNTTGIPTGDRDAALLFSCNDPATPMRSVPIHLQVRSPATLRWISAAQTSTNGTGVVTLSNCLYDAEGDLCQMELQWSPSLGGPWNTPWIDTVQASGGTAMLDHAVNPVITSLVTRTGASLVTNLLTFTWDSNMSGTGVVCSATTVFRGRTWDGLFWSSWVTSQPFMVDNEAPSTPTHLISTTHWTGKWSTHPAITLWWNYANDGAGIGVAEYLYGAETNTPTLSSPETTTERTVMTQPPGDGTNIWVWVRARDAYGNLGAPALSGPYWIDTTPPSAANAIVTPTLSAFGNYLVGASSVTGSWTGFTDSGSGIAGYYISLQNAEGTTNGIWQQNTSGILSTLAMDKTNSFYVWARDQLGWIGQAAKTSFLALSPGVDWDHDGVSNAGEEIAGTDATDGSSNLKVITAGIVPASGTGFVLQWPGLANRHYTIYCRDNLPGGTNWPILSGAVSIPGTNGIMTFVDQTPASPTRFYKISVTAP